MEITVNTTAVSLVINQQIVIQQQENAWEIVNPGGKDFGASKVRP